MATLAEQQLSDAKFAAMCDELRGLSAKPGLEQIRAVMVRYGVTSPTAKDGRTPSLEAAKAVRDGPFKRYIDRLSAGRDTREALVTAVGAGAHPLDAIEEALVIELQDLLVGGGDEIDVKYLVSLAEKLRVMISMRENSRRQQADLERKQRETTARLELAEQREQLLAAQVQKFERERTEWQEKRAKAKEAVAAVTKKAGLSGDTRKLIEEALAKELS